MIRSGIIAMLAAMFFVQSVACQAKSSPDPFSISTATPGRRIVTIPTSETPQATEDYVTSGMPHCRGLSDLRSPLKFDWPDIEEALEKLEDYNWGYYACAMPQPELAFFLGENMRKPPHLWREVNHAYYASGQVTLYYQPFSVTFMYVWMLPKPDTQTSYMIIARGDPGTPQTWECWKRFSPPGFEIALSQRVRGWAN
jgi:hypothetical protein